MTDPELGAWVFELEYVEGGTLGALLAGGARLDPVRVRGIFQGILEALRVAHERGIVHGDVKPANVFVATGGLVKLGDFDRGDPYVFPECLQTIYPIKGRATPVAPPNVIEYEVPDMYGRPWAQIWEKYFETGMQKPAATDDIFSFEYPAAPRRSAPLTAPGWDTRIAGGSLRTPRRSCRRPP